MATSTLVGRDLSGGEQLLAELDRGGMPITAAFWCFPTAERDWSLVISTPLVDREGPLPVYQRLQAALDRLPGVPLSVREIFAVGQQDPVVRRLQEHVPPNFAPDHFSISLTFAPSSPYAPYLSEGDTGVSLYVYRLVPRDADREASA